MRDLLSIEHLSAGCAYRGADAEDQQQHQEEAERLRSSEAERCSSRACSGRVFGDVNRRGAILATTGEALQ